MSAALGPPVAQPLNRGLVLPTRLAPAGAIAVLAAYALSALLIPTLADVAVTDDWVYYRSVETLLVGHELRVHDMSSAALVFQTLWGAAFAAVFGLSFGVLRVSTLVIVGIGGLAMYALCRELNISRRWSALAMAACLFHPLLLSLAYTFMTDGHFVALLLVATWLYVRGLRRGETHVGWVLAGSAVASSAMLVRQQGVLVPASVVAALLLGRRLAPWPRGLRLVALTCTIPALTAVAYNAWLRFGNGTPWALSLFWSDIDKAGWTGLVGLVPRLFVIEALYVGFFVLPVAMAMLPRVRMMAAGAAAWPAIAWAVLVAVGAIVFWLNGFIMPYVGQFVTPTGIGPEDLIAARPVLLDRSARVALTVACAAASILAGIALARRSHGTSGFFGGGAGITAAIAVGQVAGTVPPSIHFSGWGGTLDRYLLPCLPFALLLVLWALREVPLSLPLAAGAVLVMGAWSVAGTRDHLVFVETVWSVAREANALGIPDTRLDAGASWDGFHVYERPPDPSAAPRTPNPPWWTALFAPQTDSSYVVAGAQLPGYTVLLERSYWSWLQHRPLVLYLLRRPDVTGPP